MTQDLPAPDLNLERTILAADRTLLAWVRSGLSLIGFGFTIFKALEYLREIHQYNSVIHGHGARNFAAAMIALGMLGQLLGVLQYHAVLIYIRAPRRRLYGSTFIIAMATLLLGILAMLGTVFRQGVF